jgi:hypothetical protein
MGGLNGFCIHPADQSKVITVGQERSITYWDMKKV